MATKKSFPKPAPKANVKVVHPVPKDAAPETVSNPAPVTAPDPSTQQLIDEAQKYNVGRPSLEDIPGLLKPGELPPERPVGGLAVERPVVQQVLRQLPNGNTLARDAQGQLTEVSQGTGQLNPPQAMRGVPYIRNQAEAPGAVQGSWGQVQAQNAKEVPRDRAETINPMVAAMMQSQAQSIPVQPAPVQEIPSTVQQNPIVIKPGKVMQPADRWVTTRFTFGCTIGGTPYSFVEGVPQKVPQNVETVLREADKLK